MKNLFLTFALITISTLSSFGQEKYFTKSGNITFEASVGGTFEEIKAENKSVTSILNINSGEIAALALLKGFRFKIALMEEHFNENYVESDVYPKAKFSGKIQEFSKENLSSKPKEYSLKGELSLHGKSKQITAVALVKKEGDIIYIETSFIVSPEDFDIKIPNIVSEKIAKNITIHSIFQLQQKQLSN